MYSRKRIGKRMSTLTVFHEREENGNTLWLILQYNMLHFEMFADLIIDDRGLLMIYNVIQYTLKRCSK